MIATHLLDYNNYSKFFFKLQLRLRIIPDEHSEGFPREAARDRDLRRRRKIETASFPYKV